MYLKVFSAVIALLYMVNYAQCESITPFCLNSANLIQNTTNGFNITGALPGKLGLSVVCQFATNRSSSQFLAITGERHTNGKRNNIHPGYNNILNADLI